MPDRIIRASICTSDTLNKLSDFEERFWHRLIVNCDDFGIFDARPAILKGSLFPLSDGKTKKDMADALNKLASVGLVELYTVDGKPFLHVVKWSKYQRTRAKCSRFPQPTTHDNICLHTTTYVADNEPAPSPPSPPLSLSPIPPISIPPIIPPTDPPSNTTSARAREAVAGGGVIKTSEAVMDFMNRVNPSAPYSALQEIAQFEAKMGTDVCKRAFDIALGERKTSWSYIRAILRDKLSRGVRCLADWERLEVQREAKKTGDDGYEYL